MGRMNHILQRVKGIPFAFFGLCLLILASVTFFLVRHYSKEKRIKEAIENKEKLSILINASLQIRQLWHEGNAQGVLREGMCPSELGDTLKNDNFYRCNPNFLQCLFDERDQEGISPIIIRTKTRNWEIDVLRQFPPSKYFSPKKKRFYTVLTRSFSANSRNPSYGIKLTLKIKGEGPLSLSLILEDTCREALLPERFYAYAPRPTDLNNDWRFDTLGRKIFIDKYLVSNRDIAEWLDIDSTLAKEINFSGPWDFPSTTLGPEQMERFCAFRGKHLFEAHLADAASFHPADISDPSPLYNSRGPYPFSFKEKSSFLYKAGHDPGFIFKQEYCQSVYTQECQEYPYSAYDSSAVTWMGISQSLGGVMEMYRNPLDPELRLRASSMYFPASSPWHALGLRAAFQGPQKMKENIDWTNDNKWLGEPDTLAPLKIGFRCYRLAHKSETP